jgi:hypothetical protein
MKNELEKLIDSCDWTPELIVSMISEIIWPLTILIIGWKFRGGISGVLTNFFSKNDIAEVSASATGITAKFTAIQEQASISSSAYGSNSLPDGADYASLAEIHRKHETEFSKKLKAENDRHVSLLEIDDKTKIDLLTEELSLYQSALRYADINKALFRSQYDLFDEILYENNEVTVEDVKTHLENFKKSHPGLLDSWDYVKYMAFPLSSHLIENSGSGYRLTSVGRSYVNFMKRNLNLIDDLSKL